MINPIGGRNTSQYCANKLAPFVFQEIQENKGVINKDIFAQAFLKV